MLDELLSSLHDFSLVVLPILGALVLIYIVVLLRKIISVFSRMDVLLTSVDQKVAKLDGPLDSLVRLSHSVDLVHDATLRGVHGMFQYALTNWGIVSDWFSDLVHKSKETSEGAASVEINKGDE